jgi:hypothetical protein
MCTYFKQIFTKHHPLSSLPSPRFLSHRSILSSSEFTFCSWIIRKKITNLDSGWQWANLKSWRHPTLYQQIPHKTCCSQLGKFLRQPCLLFEQFLLFSYFELFWENIICAAAAAAAGTGLAASSIHWIGIILPAFL